MSDVLWSAGLLAQPYVRHVHTSTCFFCVNLGLRATLRRHPKSDILCCRFRSSLPSATTPRYLCASTSTAPDRESQPLFGQDPPRSAGGIPADLGPVFKREVLFVVSSRSSFSHLVGGLSPRIRGLCTHSPYGPTTATISRRSTSRESGKSQPPVLKK